MDFEKEPIGPNTFLYPMPLVLVAATVNGKPNCLPVAYCGIAQHKPPMIAISLGRHHYTNKGILASGTFTVNLPSQDMMEAADYAGLFSGLEVDKSELFSYFYGDLLNAPMIKECPVNMECRLERNVDLGGGSDLFIGEIIQCYSSKEFLNGRVPDITKVKPFLFSMHDYNYWAVGHHLGQAWSAGKNYKPKKQEK